MNSYNNVIKKINEGKGNSVVLFILEEKYGNQYYTVSTVKGLNELCVKLVEDRKESGYYSCVENPEVPEPPAISSDQYDSLPDGDIKEYAKNQLKAYAQVLEEYQELLNEGKILQKIIETNDGKLAYSFLSNRTSYEYERIDTEFPDNFS